MVEHLWFCTVPMVEHKQFKHLYLGKLGKLAKENFGKLKLYSFCDNSATVKVLSLQRAYTKYEAAIALMVEIGDRNGQVDVLSGMAKSLVQVKELAKEDSVCECQVKNCQDVPQ